jgi:hypothetical protein
MAGSRKGNSVQVRTQAVGNKPDEFEDEQRSIKKAVEGMTTEELRQHLKELMDSPGIHFLNECYTARIYVTFRALDTRGVTAQAKATFGPYLNVDVSETCGVERLEGFIEQQELRVTTPGGIGESCETFVLAVLGVDGWRVNDGLSEDGTPFQYVEFHTAPLTSIDP